ncbi:MAG: DNA cytosine methyltransferase [Chryseobacterium sp.]|nr:MAG: DNA cytosine methyltransferase [Chryseobacterium sp.]
MLNLSNTETQILEGQKSNVSDIDLPRVNDKSPLLKTGIASKIKKEFNDETEFSTNQSPLYENSSEDFLINDRPWSVFGSEIINDNSHKYTHVSLFTGCGGFDLGFRQAGFKTIFANDLDPEACHTYRYNIGEIVEGDLRKIELPKFKKRPDVLSAGFPCQPFSNAGSRRGLEDDRGTLFQTAIDIVEKLKPRAVVFENVRGLLSFKKDDKLLIEEICSQLDSLGYDIVFSLIDASRHNVAQKRLRVVIVGIERSKSHGRFSFPAPVDRTDLSLKHTILDLRNDALNQNELMQLNPQAIHIGSMVPEGGSWKNIPYDKLPPRLQRIWDNIERYRWPAFYRRFHRDEIAGTITAAFKPENAGVWHPTEKRIFSVREIGRIQSFPDWFKFEGKNIKSKYQQIGNAVPPRLAYELGKQILEVLEGKDQREGNNYLTFERLIAAGKPLRAKDRDVIFSKEPLV